MHAGSHTGSARASFCVMTWSLTYTWFLSFHLSLIIKLLVTSAICLGGSVINDCGLYHIFRVGSTLSVHMHARQAKQLLQMFSLLDLCQSNPCRGMNCMWRYACINTFTFLCSLTFKVRLRSEIKRATGSSEQRRSRQGVK
jgi:hypothetical protein